MSTPAYVLGEVRPEERKRLTELFKCHFEQSGFPFVELPLIEKTDHFLDLMSDEVRRKTYAFSGRDGEEFWVRSDFTLSACRDFANRFVAEGEEKLSYSGSVYQERSFENAGASGSPEQVHVGIEFIRPANELEADVEVLSTVMAELKKVEDIKCAIELGDLSLFDALVGALDLSDRVRQRLIARFRGQSDVERFLRSLREAASPSRESQPLISVLARSSQHEGAALVSEFLALSGITVVGDRSLEEIVERLLAQSVDAQGLSPGALKTIEEYLAIMGPVEGCVATLKSLARDRRLKMDAQIDVFEKRLALIKAAGVDLSLVHFSTRAGKAAGYYTGFYFEIFDPAQKPNAPTFAAGGRYDRLIKMLGAPQECPAVGAAVYIDVICRRER